MQVLPVVVLHGLAGRQAFLLGDAGEVLGDRVKRLFVTAVVWPKARALAATLNSDGLEEPLASGGDRGVDDGDAELDGLHAATPGPRPVVQWVWNSTGVPFDVLQHQRAPGCAPGPGVMSPPGSFRQMRGRSRVAACRTRST